MQRKGAYKLSDVTPGMIYSFFYDGEKAIRGSSYVHKIKVVLETANAEGVESSNSVINLLPSIRDRHRIFDYLTSEESAKVFECLKDPKSPISMMERSVGWILYFLGMRGTDISRMRLSDIDWGKGMINIVQSKTGVPLRVPINAAIGNSVFSYITGERPISDRETVFLRKTHPHDKISNMGAIINRVFDAAGIRTEGRTRGVRPMRHHLVTSLLTRDVDCPTVSSIVGHRNGNSLVPYVDTDLEHLRMCALSIDRYPVDEKVFAI